ncbi:hypothetical protein LX36DRAFT_368215 [Colletotrichum falcatum]|nr:hypothetical protein LX36DRAFT_368215 [Colletotrichum falcatum]
MKIPYFSSSFFGFVLSNISLLLFFPSFSCSFSSPPLFISFFLLLLLLLKKYGTTVREAPWQRLRRCLSLIQSVLVPTGGVIADMRG